MKVRVGPQFVLLLVLILFLGCVSPSGDAVSFTIAAVQFNINKETYREEKQFRKKAEKLIQEAAKERKADLIIFPEYTSVFLALMDYAAVIEEIDTFAEGLGTIGKTDRRVASLKELFLLTTAETLERMDRVWGGLARKYGVYIVAGTALIADQKGKGEQGLYNRTFVYGPDGKRIYIQDKVYPTDFEKDVLDLSPGSFEEIGSFVVKEKEIVVSICRDTFMEEWESIFEGATLWLDLKANGDTYDREAVENFKEALPERIACGTVPYGITVCLTGSFLDLFWEGESSIIRKTGNGYSIIDRADNWTGSDILYLTLP